MAVLQQAPAATLWLCGDAFPGGRFTPHSAALSEVYVHKQLSRSVQMATLPLRVSPLFAINLLFY